MTHPDVASRESFENWPLQLRFGAIQANYAKENGPFTQDDPQHAWLKTVYDPISLGRPPINSSQFFGMGQDASQRWGNGFDPLTGTAFPQWDYRRILAHYYSEIQFTNISPTPPDNNRANIMQIQGIPLDGSLTLCPGAADRTGIVLNYQNVGRNTVACSGNQTFIGYHLYKEDGSGAACAGCEGYVFWLMQSNVNRTNK